MSLGRKLACAILILVLGASLSANWLAPAGYARQYRDAASAGPSRTHWLGTDEIGRDRFARVLYGTRISLLLAPAAALLSTLMAAFIGGLAGYLGGGWARTAMAVTDLFLSLPWLFLADHRTGADAAKCFSVGLGAGDSFCCLDCWAGLPQRGFFAALRLPFVRQGILCGRREPRGFAFTKTVLAACRAEFETRALRPVFGFRFRSSILSEANLGILGLGVAEPHALLGKFAQGVGRPGFRR